MIKLTPDQEFTVEEMAKIEEYKNSIDFSRPEQITIYGAAVQSKLNTLSDSTLKSVKTKDLGEVGVLAKLTVDIKHFDKSVGKQPNKFIAIFLGLRRQMEILKAEYSKIETNINNITSQLEAHSFTLQKDIIIFNQQYDENWKYYRDLVLCIEGGDLKIKEMYEDVLPRMKAQAEQSQTRASQNGRT